MTLGFSRDDAGKFIKAYIEKKIFKEDPFVTLDQVGVGQLMKIAVEKGRKVKKDMKMGICGEHGGDPCIREILPSRGPNLRLLLLRSACPSRAVSGRAGGHRRQIEVDLQPKINVVGAGFHPRGHWRGPNHKRAGISGRGPALFCFQSSSPAASGGGPSHLRHPLRGHWGRGSTQSHPSPGRGSRGAFVCPLRCGLSYPKPGSPPSKTAVGQRGTAGLELNTCLSRLTEPKATSGPNEIWRRLQWNHCFPSV